MSAPVDMEVSIPPHKSRERRALTSAERGCFIDACATSFYGVFYRLLLDTGLRPGEASGLRWADIDFEHGRIVVERAVKQRAGTRQVAGAVGVVCLNQADA